ncbi:MAG TPA: hypothetical protein VF155_12065 [Candidatus Dormibacteraeota bacterium]
MLVTATQAEQDVMRNGGFLAERFAPVRGRLGADPPGRSVVTEL